VSTVPIPHVAAPDVDFVRVIHGVKQARRITTDHLSRATGISATRIDAITRGGRAFYSEGAALLELFTRLGGRIDYVRR
jgi:hypothetical protein